MDRADVIASGLERHEEEEKEREEGVIPENWTELAGNGFQDSEGNEVLTAEEGDEGGDVAAKSVDSIESIWPTLWSPERGHSLSAQIDSNKSH